MIASTRTKSRPSLSMKTLSAAVGDPDKSHQVDGLPSNSKLGTNVHRAAGNQSITIQGMELNTSMKPSSRSAKRSRTESTKSPLALKIAAMPSTSNTVDPPLKVDIRFDPSKQQKDTLAKDTVKQDSKQHCTMMQKSDSEKCTTTLTIQSNDVLPSTSTRNVASSITQDSPLEVKTAFDHLYPSTQEEGLVYWDWGGQVDGDAGESPKKRPPNFIIKNCDSLPPSFNKTTIFSATGRSECVEGTAYHTNNELKRKQAEDSMASPPAKKAHDDSGGFSLLELQLAMNPVADSPNEDTGDELFDFSLGLGIALNSPAVVLKRDHVKVASLTNKAEETDGKQETRVLNPPCQCTCSHQAQKAEIVSVPNQDAKETPSTGATEIKSHTSTIGVANIKSHPSATNSKPHSSTSLTSSKSHPSTSLTSATSSKSHPSTSLTSATNSKPHPITSLTSATNSKPHPITSLTSATNSKPHPSTSLTSATNSKPHPSTSLTGATNSKPHSSTSLTGSKSHRSTSLTSATSSKPHPSTSLTSSKPHPSTSLTSSKPHPSTSLTSSKPHPSTSLTSSKSHPSTSLTNATSSKPHPSTSPMSATNSKSFVIKKDEELLSPLRSAFYQDDSMTECLIACSILAEEECRKSQEMQEKHYTEVKPTTSSPIRHTHLMKETKPAATSTPIRQTNLSRKPASKQVQTHKLSTVSSGGLEFVTSFPSTSSSQAASKNTWTVPTALLPRKSPRGSGLSQKAVSQRRSPRKSPKKNAICKEADTDFNPSWMENIKQVTSPLNTSLSSRSFTQSMAQPKKSISPPESGKDNNNKKSLDGSKSISRTLFSPNNSTKKTTSSNNPINLVSSSHSSPVPAPEKNRESESKPDFNTSCDIFEDSFDSALLDIDKIEAQYLSQIAQNGQKMESKVAPTTVIGQHSTICNVKVDSANAVRNAATTSLPVQANLKPVSQPKPALASNNSILTSKHLNSLKSVQKSLSCNVSNLKSNNSLPGKNVPQSNVQVKSTLGQKMHQNKNNVDNLKSNNALPNKSVLSVRLPQSNLQVKSVLGQKMHQNNVHNLKSNNALPDKSVPSLKMPQSNVQTIKSPTFEAQGTTQHLNQLSISSNISGITNSSSSSITPSTSILNKTSKIASFNNNNVTKVGQLPLSTTNVQSNLESSPVDNRSIENKSATVKQLKAPSDKVESSGSKVIPKVPYHKTVGGSPLSRHKSADFGFNAAVRPAPSNVQHLKSSVASPLVRHRSAGDVTFQAAQQKYTAQEIERKRLEARQRLLQRKQQQQKKSQ